VTRRLAATIGLLGLGVLVPAPAVVAAPSGSATLTAAEYKPGPLGLPENRTCKYRPRFMFRVVAPRGERIRVARLYVNGRLVHTRRGDNLFKRFRVRGIPRTGRFRLTITVVTRGGKEITRSRTYRDCSVPERPRTHVRVPGCAPDVTRNPSKVHPGGEWRTYGHDVRNTRHQKRGGRIRRAQAPKLAPVWTFSTKRGGADGDIVGTPIVADGCVFVGTGQGFVFALNADTGKIVWRRKLGNRDQVNNTVAVADGKVFVGVTNVAVESCSGRTCDGPYVTALDQRTGKQVWRTRGPVDQQAGADMYGSPVYYDPTPRWRDGKEIVVVGVSGWAAEGQASLATDEQRNVFQGSVVLLDANTGQLVRKMWTIHPPGRCPSSTCTSPGRDDEYAGATVWATPAIDERRGIGYVPTGNPFRPEKEARTANAVLKFGVDRRRRKTLGRILDSGKGHTESYVDHAEDLPCADLPTAVYACAELDLDFGSSPNLFVDERGRQVIGAGQKSGTYHLFDTATMKARWRRSVGPPTPLVGGIVGSPAFDGRRVYGPTTYPPTIWALDRTGTLAWQSEVDAAYHYGPPVAVSNGVAYSVDFNGNLDAWNTATGEQILSRPMSEGSRTDSSTSSQGGLSVARNTVYAAVGTQGDTGYVIAFRPGGRGSPPPDTKKPPKDSGDGGEAQPGEGPTILAGPGAQAAGFATPAMLMPKGSKLLFQNLDAAFHDVTARDAGANGLPLFSSDRMGTGQVTEVVGARKLKPGAYDFFCSVHPSMVGELRVTPGE
jgi:polyvinyl alcohol dehydrogenase (cytochrome)